MPANYSHLPTKEAGYNRVADVFLQSPHYEETNDNRQAQLRDLLTDLRHYADVGGLDFQEALDGSNQVYLEEKAGQ